MDDAVLQLLHGQGRSARYIATFMICGSKLIRQKANALGLAFRDHHKWTPAEDKVLRARYPDEPAAAVAKELGLTVGQVHRRALRLRLKKSEAFYTSDRSGRAMRGRVDPRLVATQFSKGHVPANKGLRRPGWTAGRMAETQFKKGQMSGAAARNYVPIGTEKIDRKRNVLVRKVTDDPSILPVMRWRPVHVMVWEAVHGLVPPGHIVIFKRGQKTFVAGEITADKLELVTLAENMRRNTVHNLPKELAQVVQLRGALVRQIRRRQKHHGND